MFTVKRLIASSLFVFVLFSTALAQENRAPAETAREPVAAGMLVTVTATAKRVRFVSPGTAVQLRLEVYNATGQKVLDTDRQGGNVLDWNLQDGAGQPLPTGSYACVLTIKSLSGRSSQRVGLVTVDDQKTSIEPAGVPQLSLGQQQTIGPVEGNAAFTILRPSEAEAITAVTHDGADGQLTSTKGALTFRTGDLFSGEDKEQMRLTEEGNLGIGTSTPQSKLDVAGTIRAERFLVVKPKLASGDKTTSGAAATDSIDLVQPLIAGSGTQNQIAKWTDNSGTLGDSGITENGGNVGIGTTAPGAKLEVNGNIYVPNTGGFLVNNGQSGMVVRTSGNLDLYNGNAVRATLDTNGNFGIGTASPGAKLEVTGNIYVPNTGGFLVNNGQSGLVVRTSGNLDLYNGNAVKVTVDTAGKVGIGTTSPAVRFHVAGGDVLFENKWRTETTAYSPNLIGGFLLTGFGATLGNRVTPGVVGATIGGGGFNGSMAFPTAGSINGDFSNRVTDWFGTVGGGLRNRAGNDDATLDNALYATVGGGQGNAATGQYATVGGGANNTASGQFATVGGSEGNTASGTVSTVGGGSLNTASFPYATVSGGGLNTSSGHGSTVGGGESNTASGPQSTVPGGAENTAQGQSSFAAGRQAKANHTGAFVWSDTTFTDFASTGNNQFLIRASGGVGIGTNTPSNALSVNGGANFSGGVAIGGLLSVGVLGTSGFTPLCRDLFGTISGCSSSLRYKKDVALFAGGLDIINRLRPIAFTWKQGEIRDVGLAAEDVAKVEPLLTFRNEKGEVEGVRYNQLSAVFINAFKEQQQQIARQRDQINQQQTRLAQQQQQFDALRKVVCRGRKKAAVCK